MKGGDRGMTNRIKAVKKNETPAGTNCQGIKVTNK